MRQRIPSLASVAFTPKGVEIKAERRKPSGEKPCDIEDIPSFIGVLAHFRLHSLASDRLYAVGAKALELAPPPPGILIGLRSALRRRGQGSSARTPPAPLPALVAASSASAGASSWPPIGFTPKGVEIKAERRKPSGEKHCDIEDTPSFIGVLAHIRLHSLASDRLYAVGALLGLRSALRRKALK